MATQVVRSCALYIGFADRRVIDNASRSGRPAAMARMSAAVCELSNSAAREKKVRVTSLSLKGS